MEGILADPVTRKLLGRSNLTQAQFEVLLLDQLGEEMAERRMKRQEMAEISRKETGISRGALNRTLAQAKRNVSQSIHTFLLLGYTGLIETPSLSPFLEASDRLKESASQLREISQTGTSNYGRLVENLMDDLEEAFSALTRKTRDA
jgi:hypothetical protein